MNTRLASVAALVLSLGVPYSSAFAQGYNAPAGIERQVRAYDGLTTDPIRDAWSVSSAKGGNAEQNAHAVPNYGMTSGGPRR